MIELSEERFRDMEVQLYMQDLKIKKLKAKLLDLERVNKQLENAMYEMFEVLCAVKPSLIIDKIHEREREED